MVLSCGPFTTFVLDPCPVRGYLDLRDIADLSSYDGEDEGFATAHIGTRELYETQTVRMLL